MDEQEKFPPKPGGMVDRARRALEDIEDAVEGMDALADTGVPEDGYAAIRVVSQAADVYAARSVTLAAGKTSLLLPEDRNRKRATILVVTASSTVVLSPAQGNADSGTGFTLASSIALPVEGKGMLYVNNPGASSVVVSVLSELYAPGV